MSAAKAATTLFGTSRSNHAVIVEQSKDTETRALLGLSLFALAFVTSISLASTLALITSRLDAFFTALATESSANSIGPF